MPQYFLLPSWDNTESSNLPEINSFFCQWAFFVYSSRAVLRICTKTTHSVLWLARFNQRISPLNQSLHDISIYYLLSKALEFRVNSTSQLYNNNMTIWDERTIWKVETANFRTICTCSILIFHQYKSNFLRILIPKPWLLPVARRTYYVFVTKHSRMTTNYLVSA
jgi:hypothetical protein